MTKIGNMNAAAPTGSQAPSQGTDAVGKDLKRQIAAAQKKLQELSANQEMSPEQKSKKRQEIQKEITELNQQLRQHQIDMRREKQQEQVAAAQEGKPEAAKSEQTKTNGTQNGFSQEGMQALIKADGAIEQAKVQGSVASEMKGKAGVLEIEIKQDGARGGDTSAKEEALAEAEKRASQAQTSQVATVSKAAEEVADANSEGQTEEEKTKEEKTKEQQRGTETDHPLNEYRKIDVRL